MAEESAEREELAEELRWFFARNGGPADAWERLFPTQAGVAETASE